MAAVFRAASWSALLVVNGSLASTPQTETPIKIFRFHMPNEPHSLDPAKLTSTDASYFFNNVMRGLYSYSNDKGLVAEDAAGCEFVTALKLTCAISSDARWSDGSAVIAEDYVRAFRHLASPSTKNPTSLELLRNVKGFADASAGRSKGDSIGVSVDPKGRLNVEFERRDPDFLFKLSTPLLVPVKSTEFPARSEASRTIVNGPYKVSWWSNGKRLRLEKNEHYSRSPGERPPVEILFVDDDQTALALYEKGDLTFLRRLPTHFIPKFRERTDFHQVPVARFDYLGFGPELKDAPDFRAALSYSADYQEMRKLLDALGTPGCPSLPLELVDRERCVTFDLERARRHWNKVPAEMKTKRWKLYFSKLGGDDLKKSAEWFQAQWKKNLGVTIDLAQTEQGVYLNLLKQQTPSLFRKGVGLDRPSCLAALETFGRGGSENFIRLDDDGYESILNTLRARTPLTAKQKLPSSAARTACGEGVQFLLDRNLLIPLGRIHFTLLARPEFEGWRLNEMNQLDLTQLRVKR